MLRGEYRLDAEQSLRFLHQPDYYNKGCYFIYIYFSILRNWEKKIIYIEFFLFTCDMVSTDFPVERSDLTIV